MELFISSCGEIENEDIIDFMLADESYPYRKVLPEIKDREREPNLKDPNDTQLVKNLLKQKLNNGYRARVECLSHHDMFRQMSGNPTSITLIAAIHANPLYKKDHHNELVDMYNRVKSEEKIVVEEIGDQEKAGSQKSYIKNFMSLNISTEMSIKLLEEAHPPDLRLLYFMGCLPSGVRTADELQKMYACDHNINETLERLQQLSFFEVGVDKYLLSPYMMYFVNNNLETASKVQFMTMMCTYYKELLEQNYKVIGRSSQFMQSDAAAEVSFQTAGHGLERAASLASAKSSGVKSRLNKSSSSAMSSLLKTVASRYDKGEKEKGVIEQFVSELPNIENCLQFLIDHSSKHMAQVGTQIQTNHGFKDRRRLRSQVSMEQSEMDSPDHSQISPSRKSVDRAGSDKRQSKGSAKTPSKLIKMGSLDSVNSFSTDKDFEQSEDSPHKAMSSEDSDSDHSSKSEEEKKEQDVLRTQKQVLPQIRRLKLKRDSNRRSQSS